MGISVIPAPSAASKTMFRTTLTSGTSYTVPAGVTYLNVTLVGGGGGGSSSITDNAAFPGFGGQIVYSTLSATAGNSIAYQIGAGGSGAVGQYGNYQQGGTGGSTTFTGATTATGGTGGQKATTGTTGISAINGGSAGAQYNNNGGAGGAGYIIVEYWA
jgi:hypothetical protein